MASLVRLTMSIAAGIAACYCAFFIVLAFVPGAELGIAQLAGIAAGIAAGRRVWRLDTERGGLLSCSLLGSLIAGGIGFAGGFFGPMIFAPGANQGPLLGIFITGPLGFVLGGIGGFVYGAARRTRA